MGRSTADDDAFRQGSDRPRRVSEAALRGRRILALLYFVLALPCALSFSVVTPLFDAADEGAHLFRAIQVGQGGVLATRDAAGRIGGIVPLGAIEASALINRYHGNRKLRFDRRTLAPYRALAWRGSSRMFSFANTAIYPPVFYGPAAFAIDLGRLVRLPVMTSFRLARAANAVTATGLAALAIMLAEFGAPLMVAILALPMTLSLFGSASQDAILIACAALAASVLTRQAAFRSCGWRGWVSSGLLLGAIAAARAPYTPLACLPVLIAWRRADRRRGLAAGAIAAAVSSLWLACSVMPLSAATRAGGGLLTGAQAHWALRHPIDTARIVAASLYDDRLIRLREFIGVLGWLDIILKTSAYRICEWALLIGLLATLAGPAAHAMPRFRIALLLLAVVVGIEFALYLSWSTTGAPRVDGVQGRYFLPVALFGALLGRPIGIPGIAVAAGILVATVIGGDASAIRTVARQFGW